MIRFGKKTEKGIRTASMLVTVITLIWLTYFFSDSLISCLLLVWKHTVGRIDVPVLGSEGEREIRLIGWSGFCIAIIAVCGMRRRLASAFRGKSGKWCAVLTLPLLVVAVVTYVANWGAGYGILYRSDGNMGLYYDQIFSYVGWGVLSGLSLFAAGVYVFGMDRIYVEQKRAEQYRVQAAVYQTLEEQYTQAKRLRHDLKNHVLAMRGLWEDQAWEKLGEYLKRMENSAQLGMSEETGRWMHFCVRNSNWRRKKALHGNVMCEYRSGVIPTSLICAFFSEIYWTMRWKRAKDYRGKNMNRDYSLLLVYRRVLSKAAFCWK